MVQQFNFPQKKRYTKAHIIGQQSIFKKTYKKMVQSLGKAHNIDPQVHKNMSI